MASIDELASFQAALLELLARDVPVDVMLRHLRKDAAFAAYRSYLKDVEPRMLAVAAELVKKWGKPAAPI